MSPLKDVVIKIKNHEIDRYVACAPLVTKLTTNSFHPPFLLLLFKDLWLQFGKINAINDFLSSTNHFW